VLGTEFSAESGAEFGAESGAEFSAEFGAESGAESGAEFDAERAREWSRSAPADRRGSDCNPRQSGEIGLRSPQATVCIIAKVSRCSSKGGP